MSTIIKFSSSASSSISSSSGSSSQMSLLYLKICMNHVRFNVLTCYGQRRQLQQYYAFTNQVKICDKILTFFLITLYSLGASHDGILSGNICSENDQFVMAPSTGTTNDNTRGNPWVFSQCSVAYFQSYILALR